MLPGRISCRWILVLVFLAVSPSIGMQNNAPPSLQPASASDESALHALVEQYFGAYARKDLDGMMALWADKSPDFSTRRKQAQQFFAANDKIAITHTVVRVVAAEERNARLRAWLEMSATDLKTGKPASNSGKIVRAITCVKTENGWKITKETDAVEDLASALAGSSDQERSALLERDKELVTPDLVSTLVRQGSRLSANGNYDKAINVFNLAQSVGSRIGDLEGQGRAYLDRGVAYRRQSEYQKALDSFQQAMDVARGSGNQHLMAQCLTDRGIVQFHLGQYNDALDSYKQSLKLSEAAHEEQSVEHAQVNMGNVLRVQGNYAEAEQFYLAALGFVEKQANDSRELARILNSLGNLALVQSDYSKALHYELKALALLENGGDPEILGNVLNNIGSSLAAENSYTEALDYLRKGLEIARQTGNKHNIMVALYLISDVEHLQGNYPAALDDASKALALGEETGEKKVMTEILNTLGEIHVLRGDYAAALDGHLKGLALAEGLSYEEVIAQQCSNISSDYYHMGKFDKAVEFAERASTIAGRISDQMALFEARTNAGKAYLAIGKAAQARGEFEQAIHSAEFMFSGLTSADETRQRFFLDKTAPYQAMTEMLVAQHRNNDALVFAERAKGRTLLDVLANGRVNITRAMTGTERAREEDLQIQLVSINRQIEVAKAASKPDQGQVTRLQADLERARSQYSDFRTSLYAAHPELRTQRGQIEPISLSDAANLLPDGHSALLEFLVADQKTYLFVLTRSIGGDGAAPRLEVYGIDTNAKDLAQKVGQFRRQLSARDLQFGASAAKLYDLLLRPAQAQLSGATALLIVPDGPLWNLPFQALRPRAGRYLTEDYAISYAPSLTILREMVRLRLRRGTAHPGSAAQTLLAMGNPAIAAATSEHAKLTYRNENLAPLPEAAKEVKALEILYGQPQSQVFVGADAAEDRFKAQAGEFKILHLATHGLLNDSNPMYSHLLLSPGNPKEDGLLEAREIMDLDLHADMAVLSACETARGQITPGEGVIGLSWAFFVAGVPTTVVSQWNVESSSTAELMLAFHRGLKAEHAKSSSTFSTARALQHAELQLQRTQRYSHPFYWAGFIVMGDAR